LTNKAGDVRKLSQADFKGFRPAREIVPDIVAAYERGALRYRGQRGPGKKPAKVPLYVRFSPEVVDYFKAKGPGWQTRMDNALKAFVHVAKD
jgi:uncharacterized protein (DUF4415 family)